MTLSSDRMGKIVQSLSLGADPGPLTDDEAIFASKTREEIRTIEAQGLIVEIPGEWPGLTDTEPAAIAAPSNRPTPEVKAEGDRDRTSEDGPIERDLAIEIEITRPFWEPMGDEPVRAEFREGRWSCAARPEWEEHLNYFQPFLDRVWDGYQPDPVLARVRRMAKFVRGVVTRDDRPWQPPTPGRIY